MEHQITVGLYSYYEEIIMAATAYTLLGWVWCIRINKAQGVGNFNSGNLLYVLSYAGLLWRNYTHFTGHPRTVEQSFVLETLAINVTQAAAVTWFVATYHWNRRFKKGWGKDRELGAFNAEIHTGQGDVNS